MSKLKAVYRALIILCMMFLTPSLSYAEQADSVFIGDIITANDAAPFAEAVAVKNGRIIAVGSKDEVLTHKGSRTEIIELLSGALMPGFIDAHTHPIASAILSTTVDVSGFNHASTSAVMQSLKEGIANAEPGDWVMAFGWDPAILRQLKTPSRELLDELAPENPVLILTQTMHTAFVNGMAYERAGIGKNTPDPAGGYFERDSQGELTGTVIETNAISYFLGAFPKQPKAAYTYLLDEQVNRYAKAGYTTIVAPGLQPLMPNHIESLKAAVNHDAAPVRARTYPIYKDLKASDYQPTNGDAQFKVLGIKLWVDGSPYAGGMAMNDPYLDSEFTRTSLGIPSGSRGHLNYTDQELLAIIEKYHVQGWQVSSHVQGERAIDQYLSVMEQVLAKHPRQDHRHRIEHNALITKAQLQRAFELGITPSFYIEHVAYYGDALSQEIVGPERASRFMPMQSAINVGHTVSLHTDTPSSPLDVLHAMQTAVQRQAESSNNVIGDSETIAVNDVIKAVTINAAWQIFEQDALGSIEVGKVADFTVLSKNLYNTPPEDWTKINVVDTYLAGQRVEYPRFTMRKTSLIAKVLWSRFLAWFSS